ncbi:MAG TPA: primase-helicase zinc-binding domain-containing protein [Pirellulaceae bacterium]|nr:primase-helicase zinc-binding domain-containing protein [Pirellulaceae bacterium]
MRNHRNPRKRSENYSIADLRRLACGRWVEILTAAGIPADALSGRRGRPCPRCGGRDRFAPMPDLAERGAILCRHCFNANTDPRCGDGLSTLRWWLGGSVADACRWLAVWLGVDDRRYRFPMMRRPVERRLSIPDAPVDDDRFALMAEVMRRNMRPEWLRRAADLLGLTTEPLARLGVGWSVEHRATSWPMRDDAGRVIGVRLRCPKTAQKWAVRGSRAGLIYDPGLLLIEHPRRLWIVEGPTDTAALMSIGLDVVGVPSAGGGAEILVELARRLMPIEMIVMADADGPGLAGAERLADALMIVAPVRVMRPPADVKDARAWVCGGADRSVIESAADSVSIRSIVMEGAVSDE